MSLGRTLKSIWQDERGLSLLEIIVVLVILGLLASLSAPKLYNTWRNLQCRRAATSLASLFRYAHQQAILTKETQVVHIDLDSQVTELRRLKSAPSAGEDEDGSKASSPVTLRFPSTVRPRLIAPERASVIDSGKWDIVFYPTGNSTGETIELVNVLGSVYRIVIDPVTGLPKISQGGS